MRAPDTLTDYRQRLFILYGTNPNREGRNAAIGEDRQTLGIANDDIIWAEMDDEVLLLDTVSGEYYSLNETATEVWHGLNHGEPIDRLAAMLASKYGIDRAQADADVEELITELRALGLVQ